MAATRRGAPTGLPIRAPHYHNGVAQTDCFKLVFDETHVLWDGSPAVHAAVYGRGRKAGKNYEDCRKCGDCNSSEWMEFGVRPYVVERLTAPGVAPKTVQLGRGQTAVTYEMAEDREPVMWAGVDMNAKNNTYARPNGMTGVGHRVPQVVQRGALQDTEGEAVRRQARHGEIYKVCGTYKNRTGDHIGKGKSRRVDGMRRRVREARHIQDVHQKRKDGAVRSQKNESRAGHRPE